MKLTSPHSLKSDGVAGTGSRMAIQLLHSIQQSSRSIISSPLMEKNSVNSSFDSSSNNIRLLLRNISDSIGVDVLVSAVRANFYGRPMFSGSVITNAMTVHPQSRGLFMQSVEANRTSLVINQRLLQSSRTRSLTFNVKWGFQQQQSFFLQSTFTCMTKPFLTLL